MSDNYNDPENRNSPVTQGELVAALENVWEYIIQLTNEVNALAQEQAVLGVKMTSAQSSIDSLTAQITTLDGQVVALNSALASQDATVQAAITAINQEIATLQGEVNSGGAPDLTNLTAIVNQLQTDLATSGTADAALGTDIGTVAAIPPAPTA